MLDHTVRAQRQHALDPQWKQPPWDGIKPQEFEDCTPSFTKLVLLSCTSEGISHLMANTESGIMMARHHFLFQVWKWQFHLSFSAPNFLDVCLNTDRNKTLFNELKQQNNNCCWCASLYSLTLFPPSVSSKDKATFYLVLHCCIFTT